MTETWLLKYDYISTTILHTSPCIMLVVTDFGPKTLCLMEALAPVPKCPDTSTPRHFVTSDERERWWRVTA